MNKVAGSVVGIVVVAGVAWAGTAWYTGTRVEAEIVASIEKANTQLAAVAPEWKAALSLASFEKGVFSSTARYRVNIPANPAAPADGTAPVVQEVIITDRIDHGPFPLSRLASGKVTPVMATSNFVLERNATVEEWFKLTNDKAPLSGQTSLGYGGGVDGIVRLEPVNFDKEEQSVHFSGLNLNFDVSADRLTSTADGVVDSFSAKMLDEEKQPITFDAKNIALNSNMRNMWVGKNDLTIKQATVTTPDTTVLVTDYAQRMDFTEADNKVAGTLGYEVGQIKVNGADLASGQFVLRVKDLDAAAMQRLSDLYRDSVMRSMAADAAAVDATDPDADTHQPDMAEASPEQQQAFVDALLQALASNPSLSIDPFLIKTPNGEGRFTLKVDLTKPVDPEMTLEAITAQMVSKLDARLVLAKPMLADLFAFKAVSDGETADVAATQAKTQIEMIGAVSQQMGVARIEGSDIVSTLAYSEKQVDFNGKKMPLDDFANSLVSLVLGGGMRAQ